ncbi:hypothetical protein ISS30_00175 [bacterium]|nr:hypothetical protein [FCB group bacterium]MBL7190085.1 hypothetical protein [bacterium]
MKVKNLIHGLIVVVFCFNLFLPLVSQAAEQFDNELLYFQGGNADIRMNLNSSLISGLGSFETAMGMGINTNRLSPAMVNTNPGGLAFIKHGCFLFSSMPRLAGPLDAQQSFNDEIDSALEDLDQSGAIINYTNLTDEASQEVSAIAGVAFAFPLKEFTVGFAYNNKFDLQNSLELSGIEMQLRTIEEDTTNTPISMYIAADVNFLLSIRACETSVAFARNFNQKFGVGLTLHRTDIYLETIGRISPEGIIGGPINETSFNDPSAGYQNDFYQSINGAFSGGAWGAKFGLAYRPSEKFSLNFTADLRSDIKLDGDMDITLYNFPALNLNPDEDEETFDKDLINLAEATKTEKLDYFPTDEMTLKVPSSVSFGMAYRGISFTLSSYSGELAYEYDLGEGADSSITTYGMGLKPKFGFLMGFNIVNTVGLSFGAIVVDQYRIGYTEMLGEEVEEVQTDIPIPQINLGFGFNLNKSWRFDTLLLGLPESALKMSMTYNF